MKPIKHVTYTRGNRMIFYYSPLKSWVKVMNGERVSADKVLNKEDAFAWLQGGVK